MAPNDSGILALMTLDALIMLAGALVAAMPFLGFPPSWDTAIFFVLGVFVFALGIVVRRRESGPSLPLHKEPPPLNDGEVA